LDEATAVQRAESVRDAGSGRPAKTLVAQLAHVVGRGRVSVCHDTVKQASYEPLQGEEIVPSNVGDLLIQLHELSTKLCSALQPQEPDSFEEPDSLDRPGCHRLVADILRVRRQRNKVFGTDLFGDPAWDILLELYASERTGRRLSISGACYASGVPSTTALRWISRLERGGWIRRIGDPLDRRRSWLMLTEGSEKKMSELLSRMAASQHQAAA
jgi:DNA-binding MarR family transcriptional regulator